jgi:murein DD-endopeptidase MepM/ murein hydrolase activator NlpD
MPSSAISIAPARRSPATHGRHSAIVEKPPALPALNGRSVRNLRRVRTIHGVRRTVAIVAALFGALLGVGCVVPAYAQTVIPTYTEAEAAAAAASVHGQPAPLPAQGLNVSAIAAVPPVTARDNYGVTLPPPPPPPPPPPALEWPLPAGTRVSSGFGPRISPCAGCSSFHEGVDFDPGAGAPIHAIAAGVVVETNSPGYSALGVHVAIQHLIGGQTVVSAYGHMQTGSMHLKVGDHVTVGQVIGLVGSTGASTGPHLHFEIRAGGTTPVDPLAWMHAHLG